VDDLSIGLFSGIFSRPGLERIFSDARSAWEAGKIPGGAQPSIRYNYRKIFV
jgi:hypothetical protein